MFGSQALEVGIGLILIFLVLSLISSAVTELIEAFLKKRARDLERGIRQLLNDADEKGGLTEELYKHPLVSALFLGEYSRKNITKSGKYSLIAGTKLPSYIPARNFALALLDIVQRPTNPPADGKSLSLHDSIGNLPNERVKMALQALADTAGDDVDKVLLGIEAWYDSTMDRVAGWYKRYAQMITLVVGLAVAVTVNADAITLARSLSQNPQARTAVLEIAQRQTAAQTQNGAEQDLEKFVNDNVRALDGLGLPFGWNKDDSRTWPGNDVVGWLLKFLGWVVTALAISLGAPLWFDLLNKFMVVRSTVKPYEKSQPESPV